MNLKKRKLWILNHYANPPYEPGITRHYDLAKELLDDYDVTIFASAFDNKKNIMRIDKKESYKIEAIDGINFVWVKNMKYKGNNFKRFINMFDFAWRLYFISRKFEKPEIIIGSSVDLFTSLCGYFLSKKLATRFIFEIRDLWPQTLIDMKAFSRKHPMILLFKKIEAFLYKRAEKIIVLPPFAHEYICSLGIEMEKIVYIPNGVDVNKCREAEKIVIPEIDEDMKKHKGKFIALYCGAHGRANALYPFIETAKLLQDKGVDSIHILMYGDGLEKTELIDLSKRYNLNNIYFYPSISKTSIPYLLKNADVLLVSMLDIDLYKYGISLNKLFDYLCAGKPIVFAGNVRNNVVKENNCGISLNPEDSSAIANALLDIEKMEESQREILGKNGLDYAKNNHDIPQLALKLKNILEQK